MGKNEQQEVLENITAATLETLEKVGYDNVILIAINSKIKDPGEDVIALKGSVEGLAYMTIRLLSDYLKELLNEFSQSLGITEIRLILMSSINNVNGEKYYGNLFFRLRKQANKTKKQ